MSSTQVLHVGQVHLHVSRMHLLVGQVHLLVGQVRSGGNLSVAIVDVVFLRQMANSELPIYERI